MTMTTLKVSLNAPWRLYWGPYPLPPHSECIGTITRNGFDTGALIRFPSTGVYVQGNGVLRSLPQRETRSAIRRAEGGAK
jgi:hypothetical protein